MLQMYFDKYITNAEGAEEGESLLRLLNPTSLDLIMLGFETKFTCFFFINFYLSQAYRFLLAFQVYPNSFLILKMLFVSQLVQKRIEHLILVQLHHQQYNYNINVTQNTK